MSVREIIGNTTATPNPRPDWLQNDATKADYIRNKPEGLATEQFVTDHNTSTDAHSDIRKLVDDLATNFSSIVDTYILNINYDENLKFDTSELVISGATSPILGQGMLGYMVLA